MSGGVAFGLGSTGLIVSNPLIGTRPATLGSRGVGDRRGPSTILASPIGSAVALAVVAILTPVGAAVTIDLDVNLTTHIMRTQLRLRFA